MGWRWWFSKKYLVSSVYLQKDSVDVDFWKEIPLFHVHLQKDGVVEKKLQAAQAEDFHHSRLCYVNTLSQTLTIGSC